MADHDLLLKIRGLDVSFALSRDEYVTVVDSLDLDIAAGETLGLVGESGCGKTVSALALMGLLPEHACRAGARESFFADNPFAIQAGRAKTPLARGRDIAMIFQDALTSLDPVFTIGAQMVEAIRVYKDVSKEEALGLARDALIAQGIPDADLRLQAYPHQLSGGMRQRVMIALALLHSPRLLIADEPTTALDVTIQAQILALMTRLQRERGMAMLFITHDLGVVGQVCTRTIVMYAGRVAEEGSTADILTNPLHPYSKGLIHSMPGMRVRQEGEAMPAIPGRVPSPAEFAHLTACRFAPRCALAQEICRAEQPVLRELASGRDTSPHGTGSAHSEGAPRERSAGRRRVACHFAGEGV
jgi:peptide/nickel transport system ATP-binding protein